ncbi:GntR family transcriptional regulator [Bifidobacterium sp. MA2]|uniref:GntR family transcriptional regulator n=2 Tax=Bifidobacterium santillanense TaxID=2809028 RepID=A0ABS5UQ05_9BIFI|nr:GntR family transcriptional regulator [Bifidobacterium santillanense]
MIIEIDQSDGAPLYEQLRRQIVAAIANGGLAPGDRLPSVRSLAVDLGINLHTVNKAYAMLRDDGYITMRRGSGAAVAAPVMSTTAGARRTGTLDASDGGPSGHVAERLTGELHRLILEHKALGGDAASFLDMARSQCERVYEGRTGGTAIARAGGTIMTDTADEFQRTVTPQKEGRP